MFFGETVKNQAEEGLCGFSRPVGPPEVGAAFDAQGHRPGVTGKPSPRMRRLAHAAAARRVAKAANPKHHASGVLEAMLVGTALIGALVRRAYLLPAISAADGPPASFLEMRGSHNAGFMVSGESYRSGLARFIAGLDDADSRPAASGDGAQAALSLN